jgi:hypothetical protein
VKLTCHTILHEAKISSLQAFKQMYKIDELQSNVSRLSAQLAAAEPSQTITDTTNLNSINNYLNILRTTQIPVLNLVNDCISQANLADPTDLSKASAKFDTSLSRYQTMDSARVSYYEGWFPIHRPLKIVSMFVLFALGMLFIIVSILFFLQMKGIQVKIDIPATGFTGFSEVPPHLTQIGIAGAIAGTVIVVVGLWQKWF